MKNLKYLLLSLIALMFVTACDDMLDKKPLTEVSEEDLWNDPALIQAYVNSRYNQIGHGWAAGMLSSCVDETDVVWGSVGCEAFIFGEMSSTNLGRLNGGWWRNDYRSWSTVWANISSCNIFLERIDNASFQDYNLKERLKAEIRFLRAFELNDLLIRWGGVPIITKSFTVENVNEALNLTRATYKECVDFLVDELEQVALILPASYSGDDYGRATSVAALALKARILLYAASPLMNDNVKSPLIGYTTPESDRWLKAAKAAQAAINAAIDAKYHLYDSSSDPIENYKNIFLDATSANPEVLFARMGTSSSMGESISDFEQWNFPMGSGGWSGNCPLEELVEDYEVIENGMSTKFDWSNPIHASAPYTNRDPRFYASILYDDAPFQDRNIEAYYDVDENGNYLNSGGMDTKFGAESWNASSTGYNMRKYAHEEYVGYSNNYPFNRNWIWLRLGEQYLNLAEALYHTQDELGARAAVNVIRKRAGMPEITASGDNLLEAIKHERRIELVFEEHRYYDVRRWKEADKYFNKPVHGIEIKRYPNGSKTYEICPLKQSVSGNRKFFEKLYWGAIPQSEIDKNPKIAQNPGY